RNHLRIKTFAIFCSLAGRIDYGIIAALDAGCEPERRQRRTLMREAAASIWVPSPPKQTKKVHNE
ncbi:hypothetical protein JV197_00395, partial [Vibrio furnissii]